jgi:hypothetical protein
MINENEETRQLMRDMCRSVCRHWLAFGLAALALLLSTTLLFHVVWPHGVMMAYDTLTYLGGAISMLHGDGMSLHVADVGPGTIHTVAVTHYPPLTSALYAALMWLGVPYGLAPVVVALAGWVLLLLGIGALAYRLSGAPLAAALAVLLAGVTHASLVIFGYAMSETIFLPLLVWLMVVLDSATSAAGWSRYARLGGAALLLALLLLTRYVGVVVFGSVLLWWVWLQLSERQARRLWVEVPLLALAALPLAGWLVRSYLMRTTFFDSHFQGTNNTFLEGVEGVIMQASQLGLPALRPPTFPLEPSDNVWVMMPALGYPVALLLLGGLLWQMRPRRDQLLAPPRSPLVLFVLAYLGLYTFVQPFMKFSPLDARDMVSILVLVQPWLAALLAVACAQWGTWLLAGCVVLNIGLVVWPVSKHGVPDVLSFGPLTVHDLAEHRSEAYYYMQHGVPEWLVVWNWSYTRRLETTHEEAIAFVQQFPTAAAVVSNAPYTYIHADSDAPPTAVPLSLAPLDTWLERGTCLPQENVALVLFDWSHLRESAAHYPPLIEARCPGLPAARLENSMVYRLDATIPSYAQGLAYAQGGEWEKAIAIYTEALAYNPHSARAYADRARAYLALGDRARAQADFAAALEQMPEWDALRAERDQVALPEAESSAIR